MQTAKYFFHLCVDWKANENIILVYNSVMESDVVIASTYIQNLCSDKSQELSY